MEGLFILIGIYVLEVIIKKVATSKKNEANKNTQSSRNTENERSQRRETQNRSGGSLQDLIRQFEEAQRQASGGTYVPPTPPVTPSPKKRVNKSGLPTVEPANPQHFTFKEVAASVIQWEYINVNLLMQAFGFNEHKAQKVFDDLKSRKIAGKELSNGDCEPLIRSKTELDILFKKELIEAQKSLEEKLRKKGKLAHSSMESTRQKASRKPEEKLRKVSETAHKKEFDFSEKNVPVESGSTEVFSTESFSTDPCMAESFHAEHKQVIDMADVRRGFIWAKVLDEPRFKKHWNSRSR